MEETSFILRRADNIAHFFFLSIIGRNLATVSISDFQLRETRNASRGEDVEDLGVGRQNLAVFIFFSEV